jgi:uncharacterized damage-inducible protein DinB
MPDTVSRDLPETALHRGAGLSLQEIAAAYLKEYLDKIRLSVAALSDDGLWWRPAPGTNSAGNLLLHLAGNLSMWVLESLGGISYRRDRAGEFAAEGGATKEELLARLTEVVEGCMGVMRGLSDDALDGLVSVQNHYDVDGRAALFHAVEHMSYHTGQIVWIAKQDMARRGEGIEFYPQHAGE